MKAAVMDAFGPSSNLELRDIPQPEITPGQILVEVHATSVNPIDWKIGEGLMVARYGKAFPMVLGFDVSGVVAEVGAAVSGFSCGDEVFARSDNAQGKCYAEFVALNAGTVTAKPSCLSHAEAAAMPLTGLTALNGLQRIGQLGAGQRALINGACGGVGVYALQIARPAGSYLNGLMLPLRIALRIRCAMYPAISRDHRLTC